MADKGYFAEMWEMISSSVKSGATLVEENTRLINKIKWDSRVTQETDNFIQSSIKAADPEKKEETLEQKKTREEDYKKKIADAVKLAAENRGVESDSKRMTAIVETAVPEIVALGKLSAKYAVEKTYGKQAPTAQQDEKPHPGSLPQKPPQSKEAGTPKKPQATSR